MRSAFVTGGTGFVGSHLVEELLRRGYEDVRCLVRSDLKWLDGIPITPVFGDLNSADALRKGLAGVDSVYHIAGLTRARSMADFEDANVTGTSRLFDAVRSTSPEIEKILVTSSLAVVGRANVPVADESTPLHPISMYGRSKAQMEASLAAYRPDLPIVVVRPPAVYGPRETDIFTFFQTVSKGLCPIIGSGDRPDVSLVHVRDLVRGMVDAAEADLTTGETYFVGSEKPYAWNEIKAATTAALGRSALTLPLPGVLVPLIGAVAETAGKIFGSYPPLNREKAREIRYACKMCTSDKATRDYGYQPRISLADGIRETIEWYRARGWLR